MKNTLLRYMRHLLLIVVSTLSLAAGLAGFTVEHAYAATLSHATPRDFQSLDFAPDPSGAEGGITLQWDPQSHQVRATGQNSTGGTLTLAISQRQFSFFGFGGFGSGQILTTQVSSATDFTTNPVAAQGKEVEACGTYMGGINDGVTTCTSFYTDGHYTEPDLRAEI